MNKKLIPLLLIVLVLFAASCKKKSDPESEVKPESPTAVVNCHTIPTVSSRRALFRDNTLFLLIEKGEMSLEQAQALHPTLRLLENGDGSTYMERLLDNHVCQLDQKKSLFKAETSQAGKKWAYTTDLGDKITVGLVRAEKIEIFGQILPKGATEAFGLTWRQK